MPFFPTVTFGPILSSQLQKMKNNRLRYHYNSFDKKVDISDDQKTEMRLWITNIDNACLQIVNRNSDTVTSTDIILTGWYITNSIHPSRVLCYK